MSFDKLYKKLNLEQKKAVDFIEGPVMVIAGPGTGKTRILTLRIANILRKTDTEPENILALTFTDSGVFSMRSSLVEIIGSPGYLVNISTFHKFCNDIINNYPEDFPKIIGFSNITQGEQIKILKSIIEENDFRILKPYGDAFFYIKAIISAIESLKREGVGEEDFFNIIKKEKKDFKNNSDLYHQKGAYKGKMKGVYQKVQKRIEKNEELFLIYKKYQEKLFHSKLYDYSDMIIEVLKTLSKNKNLLLSLQEQYQYILVDEHQDTNNAQNKILELLSSFHKFPNIFMVGDQKQAIYRFQGASLLNFNYFKSLYPEMRIIRLKKNYRSTEMILEAAGKVIPSELFCGTKNRGKKIKIFSFSNMEKEALFVAESIEEKIKKGVSPSEIAVIYRDNKDGISIAKILNKKETPFFMESEEEMLEDTEILKLIILLSAIKEIGDEEKIIRAMHIDFFKINPFDIFTLIDFSKKKKEPIYKIVRSKEVSLLSLNSEKEIISFFEKVSYLSIVLKNESFLNFLEKTINDSGLLSHILSIPDSLNKMEKLNLFFDMAKKYASKGLDEFLEDLELIKKYKLRLKKPSKNQSFNKVKLITGHKAKGLEFDYVYILGASYGKWGDRRNIELIPLSPLIYSLSNEKLEEKNSNEDEKRLFYVALTRARKEILISFPRENEEGRQQIFSRFVREISSHINAINEKEEKENVSAFNTKPFFKKENLKYKEFIKSTFSSKGLSVTGLNNYIECPLKYFYSDLIKIPRAFSENQFYGIAVHNALKDFFERLKKKETKKDFLTLKFEEYLSYQPFNKNFFEKFKERGIKSLSGYYNFYEGNWNLNSLFEFNIKGAFFLPEIKLTGKIDKIEFIDGGKEVNVVDYKTGKPKSRQEIEGKTKKSKGNIKRQLVFYNILLNNFKKRKSIDYNMVSGEIDFVEPNERGIYKKEKFEIKEEEIKELKETIKKTAEEIISFSFWNKGCNKKDCPYCTLKEIGTNFFKTNK